MKDSHRASFFEAAINIIIGFCVSTFITWFILPFWGYHPSPVESGHIVFVFTITSFIRSYVVRRAFIIYWRYKDGL